MSTSPYVATVDLQMADRFQRDLQERGFEITTPLYTRFSAKKKGLTCTLYESGKLVVQGKESAEFIEFYLEPEILKTFHTRYPLAQTDLSPRIGVDESGKGDFFGPLCIAGVYLDPTTFPVLHTLGVKDSKSLTDETIRRLAPQIQVHCPHHIIRLSPPKYNQLYTSFKNLNRLLAWGHATVIERLSEATGCRRAIIDQFAHATVVEQAIKYKQLSVELTQRHRAEDDLAVAAASILARYAFIEGLDQLGREVGCLLPKGCSQATLAAGRALLQRQGEQCLRSVCKEHFKVLDAILGKGQTGGF